MIVVKKKEKASRKLVAQQARRLIRMGYAKRPRSRYILAYPFAAVNLAFMVKAAVRRSVKCFTRSAFDVGAACSLYHGEKGVL